MPSLPGKWFSSRIFAHPIPDRLCLPSIMSANTILRPAPTPVTLTTIAKGSNEAVPKSGSGSTYTVNPTDDVVIRLPKCSTAGVGTNYKFVIGIEADGATTCTTAAGDVFIGSVTTDDGTETFVVGTAAIHNTFTLAATPAIGSTWSVVMVSSTQWYITGHCKGNDLCNFASE